jgi:PAS domain S-box-containing protein
VENSNDIIYTTNLKGTITYVNPAAERVTGYTISEFSGKHFHQFVRSDYHEQIDILYGKQLLEKTPSTYQELPLVLRDGSEKWISQQVQFIFDHDEIIGFQATARDITDRRKAEEEQREREKLSTIVETAGMVCHEMNQPMQAILGHADLLSLTVKDSDPQRKRIDTIKEQIMRMSRITRKLMGITRYETKPYAGVSKIVDLDKSAE